MMIGIRLNLLGDAMNCKWNNKNKLKKRNPLNVKPKSTKIDEKETKKI